MKKLKALLTFLVTAAVSVFASSALADVAVDPIDYMMYDNSWMLYLVIGIFVIALAILIFAIIKLRRGR